MTAGSDLRKQLEALADLYGIELSYYDIKGQRFVATDEALLALLPRLGAEIKGLEDAPAALRARRRQLAGRVLEPVFVVWGEAAPEVDVKLPESLTRGAVRLLVELEDGSRFELSQDLATLERTEREVVEGEAYVTRRLGFGRTVPHGYHRLQLEVAGGTHQALLIASPERAYLPPSPRAWGLFAPAYALRSQSDLGVGGLAELERLVDLTGELGGQVVGTLPLTATFLREFASPSPYGPVSRIFWSELYIDLSRLPELEACSEAQDRLRSPELGAAVEKLRAGDLADHVAVMATLRSVLEPLSAAAFAADSPSRAALLAQLERAPHLGEYARFRAVIEKRGNAWHEWPEALHGGEIRAGDYDEAAFQYHAYVQLRMAEQVEALAQRAKAGGGGLYLDMPLGVHPDGYDAWRFRDQFLGGCSAGAPPDDLFEGGQDWGFRPLHPEAVRESGYAYVIDCMQKQFACAGALRVDHVMGLHRLFCIPHGLGGERGIYLRYNPDELYAILTLESHRNQCFIIGEDLGTVPDEVRAAMDRHGFLRMYVAQFSLSADPSRGVAVPPAQAVASVNTHDTPTFAAFWEDHDVDLRVELEHTDENSAREERRARKPMREAVVQYLRHHHVLGEHSGTADVLGGLLNLIASSDARLVLVNLEDLWGETHGQNVPGTVNEHANWQNRCRHALEAIPEVPGLFDSLRELDRRRRR